MTNAVFWDVRRMVPIITDVSECLSASNIRVKTIGELGTTLAVTVRRLLVTANVPSSSILVTLMMEAIRSSETSVLTRATRRDIPENGILQTYVKFVGQNGRRMRRK
jgi:hypothetical protein